jgi:hypothetical protein
MKDEQKKDDFSRVAEDKTWPPRKYVLPVKFLVSEKIEFNKSKGMKFDENGNYVPQIIINYAI